MVSTRRAAALAAAAAGLLAAWSLFGGPTPAALPGARRQVVGDAAGALPRIGLSRLDARREPQPLGERDLFGYGPPPRVARAPTPPPEQPAATPPPARIAPRATPEPGAPSAPPLNVSYIGTVEGQGARVAVLLTDKKEVLTGREGDLVANRLKIVKIGFESVDVQDLGSERVRRLPLEGR